MINEAKKSNLIIINFRTKKLVIMCCSFVVYSNQKIICTSIRAQKILQALRYASEQKL